MDNAVAMTVVEGAGNLSRELASLFLFEFAMGNDVVQHLAAIYKLKEHIPVVVRPDDISQAAYMGMVEQCDDSSLSRSANLFRVISPFFICSTLVAIVGRSAGDNFASNLENDKSNQSATTNS